MPQAGAQLLTELIAPPSGGALH
ncbi:Protein of unknown function [Propionibacterium freudenreichii]|nr:Protein of unknown function [Propionibacterium freudenreichii]